MDTASFGAWKTNILSLLDQTKWLLHTRRVHNYQATCHFGRLPCLKLTVIRPLCPDWGKCTTVKTQTAKTQNNWAVRIMQPSRSCAPWGGPQYHILLNNISNVGKPWIIWILVLHRHTLLLCPSRSLNQMKKPIPLENNRRFTRTRKNLQRFTKSLNLQEITR